MGRRPGRLAQHQAAFDITDGLGRLPRALERNAYCVNRAFVLESIEFARPARVIRRETPSIGLSL